MKNQIPGLIDRIERSDIGRSVDALASDIAGGREDLRDFSKAIAQIESISEILGASNEAIFKNLSNELDSLKSGQEKINSEIASLRLELNAKLETVESNLTKSVMAAENVGGVAVKAFDSFANALKKSTDNQSALIKTLRTNLDSLKSQELAAIKRDMAEMLSQMQKQGAFLDALAKKKGFSF